LRTFARVTWDDFFLGGLLLSFSEVSESEEDDDEDESLPDSRFDSCSKVFSRHSAKLTFFLLSTTSIFRLRSFSSRISFARNLRVSISANLVAVSPNVVVVFVERLLIKQGNSCFQFLVNLKISSLRKKIFFQHIVSPSPSLRSDYYHGQVALVTQEEEIFNHHPWACQPS